MNNDISGPIQKPATASCDSPAKSTNRLRAADRTRIDAATSALAASNVRVGRHIDDLAQQTEGLIAAALHEDWREVRLLTECIARASELDGNSLLADRAWQVCEELDLPENQYSVRRSIERLLGGCGRTPNRLPPPLLA